jgi:hypothetical protein
MEGGLPSVNLVLANDRRTTTEENVPELTFFVELGQVLRLEVDQEHGCGPMDNQNLPRRAYSTYTGPPTSSPPIAFLTRPAMSIVRPYGTWTPSTVPDTRARVPHQSCTS